MKQVLIELVDVILEKIQEDPGKPFSENKLRRWLQGEGYHKRDIDAAMRLVGPRIDAVAVTVRSQQPAIRTLTPYEAFKLSTEARDALVRLELYGLIDPIEREMMLDRLNTFDGEVSLDDLDYLLAWVVCGNRDVESQQTIYSVLDGTREQLH
jgi:uncharacterized protein Smg (DUF494 family)